MGAVHLKALRSIPDVALAAVVSRDEKKLAGDLSGAAGNLAGGGDRFDFSGVRKCRSLEEALTDPAIDAVDLCLPTDLHESAAIASLRAGKHVLVEKPMALDEAACDRMIEEARRAERVLMVGQVLRFFPAYGVLEQAVHEIGGLCAATFRRRCAVPTWGDWQKDPTRSGGAVLDLLIHDLDMILHLFGEPQKISATGRVEGDIDLVSARIDYATRFTVIVVGGWHPGKYPITMKYRVLGSQASVEFNFNQYPPRLTRGGISQDLPMEQVDGYAAEIAYFAECARHGGEPQRCMPEDSARAVRLARMIMESRNRGGEEMAWKSE